MSQNKDKPTPQDSDEQLRAEVKRLRRRLAELESNLDESQRTIAALQKSEHLYRIILENIPPVTYVVDVGHEPLNNSIYASPQIEKILGHAREEFLKDPFLWLDMIHPEDRDRVMAESEQADLTEGPFDTEYRVISSDNVISWFHDQSVLFKDEHEHPIYRVGILTDVTKRKQAELALQRLEDIYRRAIDAAGAVPYVISHDKRWRYIYLGEGIYSLTGYSVEEMTADIWDSLRLNAIPRGSLAELTFEEADRLTSVDHSVLWECDFQVRTRDGQTRWISDTSVKSIDEKGGGVLSVGIYQDITERKLAEEVRENLLQELEQRNAELERLAYTLSHELKSPLITIRGFMGYVREDALSGNIARLDHDLHRVGEGTDKMLRLINELIELMSVGRIVHNFTEFPLSELVNEALAQLQEKAAKKRVTVNVTDELPRIRGDRQHLLEVFLNLLDNSIKFMGKQPEPKIEIGMRKTDDADPVIYVRDNGMGIEPRFTERIFGIFHKLDAMSEGTGIGLALVKRIIEMHGGKIWFESEGLGKGTMFCFTLPTHSK